MKPKRILHIHVREEYFKEAKAGIKKNEYRLKKPYWEKMLIGKWYDEIYYYCGYPEGNDEEKKIIFPYNGFGEDIIYHKEFNNGERTEVFYIPLIPY